MKQGRKQTQSSQGEPRFWMTATQAGEAGERPPLGRVRFVIHKPWLRLRVSGCYWSFTVAQQREGKGKLGQGLRLSNSQAIALLVPLASPPSDPTVELRMYSVAWKPGS